MPPRRITKKLDSSVKKTDRARRPPVLFDVKGPHVSLYSTDDPVDKLHLVLAPLISSVGIAFPKISEPLQSFTLRQSTLNDLFFWNSLSRKLQCIPGFRTTLTSKDIQNQLHEVGAVFFSPPKGIRPESQKKSSPSTVNSCDDTMDSLFNYFTNALRISPAGSIVLNIKVGKGSPIQKIKEGRNLAQSFKHAFERMQINTSIFLTAFNQPVGEALGNSLEVKEAIEILKGSGPLDMLKLTMELGSDILLLADKTMTKGEAKEILKRNIVNGEGLEKFQKIIETQKGNPRIIDDYSLFPLAAKRIQIYSRVTGFIHKINMRQLYSVYHRLMTQERKPPDSGNNGTGFLLQKKTGESVKKNERLVEIHLSSNSNSTWIDDEIQGIFTISETLPPFQPLIIERIKDTT